MLYFVIKRINSFLLLFTITLISCGTALPGEDKNTADSPKSPLSSGGNGSGGNINIDDNYIAGCFEDLVVVSDPSGAASDDGFSEIPMGTLGEPTPALTSMTTEDAASKIYFAARHGGGCTRVFQAEQAEFYVDITVNGTTDRSSHFQSFRLGLNRIVSFPSSDKTKMTGDGSFFQMITDFYTQDMNEIVFEGLGDPITDSDWLLPYKNVTERKESFVVTFSGTPESVAAMANATIKLRLIAVKPEQKNRDPLNPMDAPPP